MTAWFQRVNYGFGHVARPTWHSATGSWFSMTLDMDIAAGERAEAVRNLIDRAQGGLIDLVIVTALELCSLGGPAYPLFDEVPARAWARLGRPQRRRVTDEAAQGLVRRRLLTGTAYRASPERPIETCALRPELGLVQAARCRPAFAVIVQPEDGSARPLRLFALGDEAGPEPGFVLEGPGLPLNPECHFAKAGQLGPLDWCYRYVLVSRDLAAGSLAQWMVSLPLPPGGSASLGWLVSVWSPGRKKHRLRIRGDGLNGLAHGAPARYDAEGLRAAVLGLLGRQ